MVSARPLAITALLPVALLFASVPSHASIIANSPPFTPTRFTVVDEGTAGKPDVVLIPGLSSSRAVWDAEAKLLAPHYRLHLVQIGGFAGAPAGPNTTGPLLLPIVDELHAYIVGTRMHPAVIGHSLGGLLALMLADGHPEDIRKIILVDTSPFYPLLISSEATVDSMRPQAAAVKQQLLAMPADQFAALQSISAAMLVKDPAAQKLLMANANTTDRTVMVNAMSEDLQTDMRGKLASINTPTLVLYATDPTSQQPDPIKYPAMMEAVYKPMPNVTLVRINESRHFIMYDQPVKFDDSIEGFLR